MNLVYPFAAVVGQESLKEALILNVIDSSISGVLIRGEKGSGKSTVVRALADILPEIEVIEGDPFQSSPEAPYEVSEVVSACREREEELPTARRKVRVVELPISATEDRLVGSIDLEHALQSGARRFEPGILAAAHRGILYVDEVNLLDDHLVDLLLDAAAMGVNTVEREGVSVSHPSRFVLVGTMNPEEGELRPQLLDRFGLCVEVVGLREPEARVEVMRRRIAYDTEPERFAEQWRKETDLLAARIVTAKQLLPSVAVGDAIYEEIARRSIAFGVDGHRADIVMLKAARALAAWDGSTSIAQDHIDRAAGYVLPHRKRRLPFEGM